MDWVGFGISFSLVWELGLVNGPSSSFLTIVTQKMSVTIVTVRHGQVDFLLVDYHSSGMDMVIVTGFTMG